MWKSRVIFRSNPLSALIHFASILTFFERQMPGYSSQISHCVPPQLLQLHNNWIWILTPLGVYEYRLEKQRLDFKSRPEFWFFLYSTLTIIIEKACL